MSPQIAPVTVSTYMLTICRLSIVTISSPGVHFGDDMKARALARRVTIKRM
jgi:hypothetical protein